MTAERKPCSGWREYDCDCYLLDLGIVKARVNRQGRHRSEKPKRYYIGGIDGRSEGMGEHDDRDVLMCSMEDAARALLLDALVTLAPGMPEGWTLTAHADALPDGGPLYVLNGATCWAELGDAAAVDAVALGMLAAVAVRQ